MKKIKVWNEDSSEKQLDEISSSLREGELVIIPTDTLYGITCDALNPKAIDKLCRLKGINPEKTNLSIICSNISMASEYARIDNRYFKLIKDNTPGSFTFLLKAASTLPKVFKGRKTVGIRIPANRFDRELVEKYGNPLLSTSIEFEDEDYAVNPDLIEENYENKVDLIVDGGEGDTEASTIVDCTGEEPEIIRQGKGELN